MPDEKLPAMPSSAEIALAEHAAMIRTLGKRVISDIIEIGRRLTEAKKVAGHGGWLPWLKTEFGWSDDTALRFMQVHEMSKSRNLQDLNLPLSGLYLLAKPSTPELARQAAIDRAERGEAVTVKAVQRIIGEARQVQAVAVVERNPDRLVTVTQLADLGNAERHETTIPNASDLAAVTIAEATRLVHDLARAHKSIRSDAAEMCRALTRSDAVAP